MLLCQQTTKTRRKVVDLVKATRIKAYFDANAESLRS